VESEAVVVLAAASDRHRHISDDATLVAWVLQHGLPAGPGTSHRAESACLHLPLPGADGVNGVLVVRPHDGNALSPGSRHLLDALAGQVALALERARLAELAAQARAAAERAALRSTLLASISHDLRAPLTAIAGAGCLVAQQGDAIDSRRRTTLGQLIEAKAREMSQLLENVLELLRLESAVAPPRADWQSLEELIGAALRQTVHLLDHLKVHCDIPDDLPLLYVDGQLIRQLVSNLLENAAKYTPAHTTVEIRAAKLTEGLQLTIEDDGPGFGGMDPERMFEKFERGQREGHVAGAGLGLAICRAVARLHGGSIHAMNRPAGGARFELRLPQTVMGDGLFNSPS
jgi:two-component system sensor histidine kinase KdpD